MSSLYSMDFRSRPALTELAALQISSEKQTASRAFGLTERVHKIDMRKFP